MGYGPYQWEPELDRDYGVPLGKAVEEPAGFWRREWSKATVELDCHSYTASIVMHSNEGVPEAKRTSSGGLDCNHALLPDFCNHTLPNEVRVRELLSKMTLDQKVAQVGANQASAV